MVCRGAIRRSSLTGSSTEPYYFPNVSAGYRPTSRFFLRLSGFVPPSRRPSPKCAKSAGFSPIGLSPPTRWGNGFKKALSDKRVQDDFAPRREERRVPIDTD